MLIRFTHLQLNDLTNQDAVVIQALISKRILIESQINESWILHSSVAKSLRLANLTAISIMANIFDKE